VPCAPSHVRTRRRELSSHAVEEKSKEIKKYMSRELICRRDCEVTSDLLKDDLLKRGDNDLLKRMISPKTPVKEYASALPGRRASPRASARFL
jgi:hypothetical protein